MKLGQVDTRPHYIVRRYAEYSGAILSLDDKRNTQAITTVMEKLKDEGSYESVASLA